MFFKCACSSEAIQVEVEKNYFEMACCTEFNFSFWQEGFSFQKILTFKDKLRWCWQIMTKGIPYTDMVVLNKEEATNLKKFLEEELNEL